VTLKIGRQFRVDAVEERPKFDYSMAPMCRGQERRGAIGV
jgi:hypothetical protein